MKYSIGLASLVVAVAGVISAPVQAADEVNEVGANATSNCQGALPNFEGNIRKRPLAVQNEGTASAFITCSFSTQYDTADINQVGYFTLFFNNQTASAKNVTCTGVAGYASNLTNTFISKNVSVAANSEGEIDFVPADNGGQGYYPLVNVSCNIPVGVGIADTYVGFNVDDA
ncbi:MAG: hypothetical protein ABJA62_10715 [Luteimonas sp.]